MSGVAFLFPGQGSQYSGMGRELARAFPESGDVFDAADRVLGCSLSRLCFEGSDEDLALTENTQPAILAVSIAALKALERRGLTPGAVGGHSLGEYSAHVAARTLSFDDALRAVRLRGKFMQEAVGVGAGAMAAIIGLERAEVERICDEVAEDEVVSPANLNSPQQIVIAGHAPAVERATRACRAAGARHAKPLAVSAPFHCSLMEPVADRLRPVLEEMKLSDPALPVFTNVDGAAVQTAGAARDALLRQVASPVLWHDQVKSMLLAGFDTFVEVGPGKVLSGLVRRIQKDVSILSVEDPASVELAVQRLKGSS